ncbi:MAG: ComEC/Rec2 family competence protein, partial [Oscillospiraceae bacterium]|nr:ComEC/Rec2 family competence protein [Oscillospiraceae bacterium]
WHITAVSGLHCSFLIALLGLFTGRAGHRRKALLGIPLLILYALTVGASASVVRAAIMIGFVLLAPLFGRENDPLTALSAALALILLLDPFAAKGASLQLSFAAVLGLLLLSLRLQSALTARGGRVRRFLAGNLSATLGALIFTVPLSAIYFNTFTVLTPVSNLLCLGAVSAAFSLGLLSVGFSFIFLPLGAALAWVAELLTQYVLLVADAVASIPYHAVYFTDDGMKWWLIYAYALFALCLLAKRKVRLRVMMAAGLTVCGLILCLTVARKEASASPLTVTVLDVGQGQCVLLTSGDECVIVDCGSESAAVDAGAMAAEELFRRGYYAPQKLILTHPDADHANGVETLCARMDVEEIWCPSVGEDLSGGETLLAAAGNCPVAITALNTLTFGEAEVSVFAPFSGKGGNDGGLAVLCSAGDFDVLITGDMSEKG